MPGAFGQVIVISHDGSMGLVYLPEWSDLNGKLVDRSGKYYIDPMGIFTQQPKVSEQRLWWFSSHLFRSRTSHSDPLQVDPWGQNATGLERSP